MTKFSEIRLLGIIDASATMKEARAQCRVSDAEASSGGEDAAPDPLRLAFAAAVEYVEGHTGRATGAATYAATFAASCRLEIPRPELDEVLSVSVVSPDFSEVGLSPDCYDVDKGGMFARLYIKDLPPFAAIDDPVRVKFITKKPENADLKLAVLIATDQFFTNSGAPELSKLDNLLNRLRLF